MMANLMDKTNKQILQERVIIGQNAQKSWDAYLKAFFKERELMLYTDFINLPFDEVKLLELKRCQLAISDLKGKVLSDITVGKASEKQLLTLP
jgi:hypothetical protein